MSEGTVNVQVSPELVQPILDAKINAAVVEAIGDPHSFVSACVDRLLKSHVDGSGKPTRKSSYDAMPMIDYLSSKAIQDAVQSALMGWVAEHKAVLQDEIKKSFAKSPSKLAKALTQGFAEIFNSNYRFQVSIPGSY